MIGTSTRSLVLGILALSTLTSCANDGSSRVGETAAGGAAIGAGVGLLIGALAGKPEAGLLVGAATGAGQGAYEGWRQDQDDERTRQLAAAIRESSEPQGATAADRARDELRRFLGVWSMEGWIQESGEGRTTVSAQVNATVEMTYFVELAYIDLQIAGVDRQVWGTSTLGYEEGAGYSLVNRFSTLPEAIRLSGTFDAPRSTFTFPGDDFRVTVRFETPDRFVAETTSGGETVESYRFTRQ